MRWGYSLLVVLLVCTAECATVVMNTGRRLVGPTLSATEDGTITIVTEEGETFTLRKEQYRSAKAERPDELERARKLIESGAGAEAVVLLENVKKRCRYLEWDQQAIFMLADYYSNEGLFIQASHEFRLLENQDDPAIQIKLREAMVKCGETDAVLTLLATDIGAESREVAAQAYLMRGDLRFVNGNQSGARRDWLKVVTYFKTEHELAQQAEEKLRMLEGEGL